MAMPGALAADFAAAAPLRGPTSDAGTNKQEQPWTWCLALESLELAMEI